MTEHTKDAGDLLPCPFCGGDACIVGTDDDSGGCFAACVACYCNVGEGYDNSAMPEHMFHSVDDAIAAWNRRAPTAEAADLIHEREAHAETQAALRAFIVDLDRANAALILAKEALGALVDEYCDYATINHLGDPERQHNIKLARAALDAISALEPSK